MPPAERFDDGGHAVSERNLVKLFDYEIDAVLVRHGTSVREESLEKLDDRLLDREWTLTYPNPAKRKSSSDSIDYVTR
ncbi:hypothetical protein HTZ84_13035 [Haloterrigena sp. SYSU A558-1]|uniref:Uncharacterized protein n=1 Tax=Haloterrigena gelatinilytica TaxID=2741724 RepID=A0ABX2LAD3_9EURY|nr:hypothetical protein [Haloterrigena gelatinilytica]NUC73224.1 hypothetical protein [Haloterrigena gelatinilytica]